ncbi:MAG TPA: FAD-binding oxidoreductase [Gemmatimonadaceae bacterium]
MSAVDAGAIGPDDPRYRTVVDKQFNKRFSARPDYVRLVDSTEQVVAAVQNAVSEGRRLVVTSGGHCLEGFVSDPDVRVIIDVSTMKRIYYDEKKRAIAVEAGATVGETFRALHDNWGVVVPLGEYPAIGIGGHVVGGAFGFLCRVLGLAADYLYGVEVVCVGKDGRANVVVATCDTDDPNRELWWAHTGGGGGNLGIVTRYWFRSPDASGADPQSLLPPAPELVTAFHAEWNWSDIDQRAFLRLLRNHGEWAARNSDTNSPDISLWSLLMVHRQQLGKIIIRGLSVDAARAERQIDDYLAALSDGTRNPTGPTVTKMSWLDFALNPFPDLFAMPPGGVSTKVKDAMLKKPLTDTQFGVVHEYMTSTDYNVMGGAFGFASFGGRVNTIAPEATAAQRSSIFDMACNAGWIDPREEAEHLRWVRAFYRNLFADTAGVPVPGDRYDGSLINHPDTDHADPALNTSGVPWHTLYYQDNYPRLQRIKARWDPRNIFHHALSIRA